MSGENTTMSAALPERAGGMAMPVEDLVRRCIAGGLKLSASAGQLRVQYGDARPDPALLELLREHKAALLAFLDAHQDQPGKAIPRRLRHASARSLASPAQRRMVLLDQIDGGSPRYNMVGAFLLDGALQLEALKAAMRDVIARHEALRTRFEAADGSIWQVVEPDGALAWECIDLSGRPAGEQERMLQERLVAENNWQFDLARGPLLRLCVLLMGPERAAMIVNVHHIACDGWSIDIIKREWADCYAARCSGTTAQAYPDRVQYGDYCHWLQQQEHRSRTQLDYWMRQLDGVPHLHSLPLDHPRPPRQGHAGSKQRRVLSAPKLAAIRQQCRNHDVTLFMFLQTAFAAVLSLYANENDIVVGTPVAGRRHRDLEGTVGLFVNTLVLRSHVDGNLSFGQLLAANKAVILQALDQQDLPFDELVEHLDMPRSRAFSPLVQILFALRTQTEGQLRFAGASVEDLVNDAEPVKAELQLIAQEQGDQLLLEWHFSTDLFAETSIGRMADSLVLLVNPLDTRMDTPLFALPLGQQAAEPVASAASEAAAPRRLDYLFEEAAARFPDRVAVACADASLNYHELDRQASALAHRLAASGVQRGDVVAMHLGRSVELIVAVFGILKAGAAYLPLDPTHPPARLQTIFEDSGARLLLTQAALAGIVNVAGDRTILLDDAAAFADPTEAAPVRDTHLAQDPAYVIYTSGTTGQPKGVVVAHLGIANLVDEFDALAPLDSAPIGMMWSNICFDLSVYETFSMLCRGGTLHIVPDVLRLDTQGLFQWIDARKITSAFMHAAYLLPFADHVRAGGGQSLRRLMVGVEPIAAGPIEAIARAIPGLGVVNAYGPTETSVCATLYQYGRAPLAADALLPIGRAVNGLELRVMNPAGEPAPRGAIGELYVGGAGLALGYLNRPELDREKFVWLEQDGVRTRFYRTGDLVRLNGHGELDFLGRIDRQVKIRGFRVELSEIEVRLCQLDEVGDAVVVASGDAAHRQLHAYVVLKHGVPAGARDEFDARARQDLRRLLPEYMVPAGIIVIDAMPLNASGKVQLERLPAPSLAGGRAVVAPRNAVETRLLALWTSVLGADGFGVTDDFFAVGGQSLLAMQLIARIRREFALCDSVLSVADLLDDPTIETFARTHARLLADDVVRSKVQYLASLQDVKEEGVF